MKSVTAMRTVKRGGGSTVWGRAGRAGALFVADAVDKFFLKVK